MAKLEDVILRDTRANQPAATAVAVGTLYRVTDEDVTERSNGTAWESYGADGSGFSGDAGDVPFTPAGTIAATDTQAAVEEVATDAATALTGHTGDAADAHDASAVSFDDTGLGITAADVQAMGEALDAAIGAGGIPATILDAKGDLIAASAADTAARLAAGANGSALIAASGEATGLKWRLNNDAASTAPTVNEDSGDGYSVGSRWLDTTNGKEYVCLDPSAGAAVWLELGGDGAATVAYLRHRLMAQIGNANTEMPVNSTAYAQTGQTDFYHDWDLFPATHFRLSCFGGANLAGQTVTFQLATIAAPSTPVSAAGDDFVLPNGVANQTTGWVAITSPPSGRVYMGAVVKGSNSSVDFIGRWFDIEFKIDP